MRHVDLHHLHAVVATWFTIVRFAMWFVICGLVALGATWCTASAARRSWVDDHPMPDLRGEFRLRREVAAGLRELDTYLSGQSHTDDRP